MDLIKNALLAKNVIKQRTLCVKMVYANVKILVCIGMNEQLIAVILSLFFNFILDLLA